eukprot:scaffold122503_cov57-Phaeocystis_antarctica.AAC.1
MPLAPPQPHSLPPPGPYLAPRIAHAFFSTRQAANFLSADNKLVICCAWAGTSAFASLLATPRAGIREVLRLAQLAELSPHRARYVRDWAESAATTRSTPLPSPQFACGGNLHRRCEQKLEKRMVCAHGGVLATKVGYLGVKSTNVPTGADGHQTC